MNAGQGEVAQACPATDVPPPSLRRLTNREYANSLKALFPSVDRARVLEKLPGDARFLSFDNIAEKQALPPVLAGEYLYTAEFVIEAALKDKPNLLGCGTTVQDDCVKSFIASFGKKAWRRPLRDDELDRLFAFYAAERNGDNKEQAVAMMLEAMISAPQFIYRVEVGSGAGKTISQYELASRLSYLFLEGPPDDALMSAADKGELKDREAIEKHARRLLADPRAREAFHWFHQQYFMIQDVAKEQKDAATFPLWSTEVASLLGSQADQLVDHALFDGGGGWKALLTSNVSFVNPVLAQFAGVATPKENKFTKIQVSQERAAGMLSSTAFLASHAHPARTSPTLRGLFVRDQLLCSHVPPPPKEVDNTPPKTVPGQSTRAKYDEHAQNPSCRGCHEQMDPIGYAFENFDGIGRWRTHEGGLEIDPSGQIFEEDSDPTKFKGVAELGSILADDPRVATCMSAHWLRYAFGRKDLAEDRCLLDRLAASLDQHNGDVKELLVSLVTSDVFLAVQGDPQ